MEDNTIITIITAFLGGGVGLKMIEAIFFRRKFSADVNIGLTKAAEEYGINMTKRLDETQKKHAELINKFSEISASFSSLQSENSKLLDRLGTLEDSNTVLSKKLSDLEEENKTHTDRIAQLELEKKKAIQQYHQLLSENETIRKENTKLKTRIDELEQLIKQEKARRE